MRRVAASPASPIATAARRLRLRARAGAVTNRVFIARAPGEASSSVLDHAKACAEAISKEAMSEGDVDAVTKDTGYGRVLGEIIRDWGVACAKRRAECLIKLVSKTVPNLSTASGGGRLATDYNKFTRRCRMVAQSARRSAASYFGPTGLPGQAGGAQAGQPGLAHSPLFTHTGSGDTTRPGHVAKKVASDRPQ